MTAIEVNRGLQASGFRPIVTVSFPEGLPRGTDRSVHVSATAKLAGQGRRASSPLDAGQVPLAESGPSELKVQLPKVLPEEIGDAENGGDLVISVEIAGRKLDAPLSLRPFMRQTMSVAERALALATDNSGFLVDPAVTRATLEHLRDRFAQLRRCSATPTATRSPPTRKRSPTMRPISRPDRDPLRSHAGIRRFAYRSPLDGELSPFGVYVPPSFVSASAPNKTYPLVIVLHGMNGKPLSMVRWFFGHDDEGRDSEWEDRHPGDVEPIEGFVIAPNALRQRDVPRARRGRRRQPPRLGSRTSSPSTEPHHHHRRVDGRHRHRIHRAFATPTDSPPPSRSAATTATSFAATRGLRSSGRGRSSSSSSARTRSGPRMASTFRSTSGTAKGLAREELGRAHRPVQGARLRDRARAPRRRARRLEAAPTKAAQGFQWLAQKTRPEHKRRIVFKTDSPRYADDAWVHVCETSRWISSSPPRRQHRRADRDRDDHPRRRSVRARPRFGARAGIRADARPKIDGTTLAFAPDAPLAAYRAEAGRGSRDQAGAPGRKRAGLSGPIRDVFFEPLVFVYGTARSGANAGQPRDRARVGEISWGIDLATRSSPIPRSTRQLAETHSLVLVGNSESNRVLRDIEPALPFKTTSNAIIGHVRRQRR